MLHLACITSEEQLHQYGAVKAYPAVQGSGQKPSLNFLWALEGALVGQPWQVIARDERLTLLLALDSEAI